MPLIYYHLHGLVTQQSLLARIHWQWGVCTGIHCTLFLWSIHCYPVPMESTATIFLKRVCTGIHCYLFPSTGIHCYPVSMESTTLFLRRVCILESTAVCTGILFLWNPLLPWTWRVCTGPCSLGIYCPKKGVCCNPLLPCSYGGCLFLWNPLS